MTKSEKQQLTISLSPELIQFARAVDEGVKGIVEWVHANRDRVRTGILDAAKFLVALHEWMETTKHKVQRVRSLFEEGDFEMAMDGFTFHDILEFADLETEDLHDRLLLQTETKEFLKDIEGLYHRTGLRQERLPLLCEAVEMHQIKRYAGAVPLLYSQIEGIVNDASARGVPASNLGPRSPGLDRTLCIARDRFPDHAPFFEKLRAHPLVGGQDEATVPKTRNAVLHGRDISFANPTRSLQLVFWLYALLLRIGKSP